MDFYKKNCLLILVGIYNTVLLVVAPGNSLRENITVLIFFIMIRYLAAKLVTETTEYLPLYVFPTLLICTYLFNIASYFDKDALNGIPICLKYISVFALGTELFVLLVRRQKLRLIPQENIFKDIKAKDFILKALYIPALTILLSGFYIYSIYILYEGRGYEYIGYACGRVLTLFGCIACVIVFLLNLFLSRIDILKKCYFLVVCFMISVLTSGVLNYVLSQYRNTELAHNLYQAFRFLYF